MNLKQFIYDLEANDLYHYAKIYKDPIWRHFVFIENHSGCGLTYERQLISWCEENCKKEYSVFNGCIAVFESNEDALAFKLRWT